MNYSALEHLTKIAKENGATLVAVSKTYPKDAIQEAYNTGIRDFGENRVQELVPKFEALPKDIRWHLIGHLQSNKVKYIAPFVALIHSVDSLDLLHTIHKQALKNNRVIDVLLQVYIAKEETKFGLSEDELWALLDHLSEQPLSGIRIRGLMGMASFTDNILQVESEFSSLKLLYDKLLSSNNKLLLEFNILSMGMSGDYEIALQKGSNMIRVGSLIFGKRG